MTTTASTDDHAYTCRNCGSHNFVVRREYEVVEIYVETTPCHCGSHEYAAEEHTENRTRMWNTYVLDDDHRFDEAIDSDDYGDTESQVVETKIVCDPCYDEASYSQAESELESSESEDQEYWVHCADCDHEIEFGWSHPDRGGRIWPCESSDFNPWKSWPEPRYKESWGKRGWLRPVDGPRKKLNSSNSPDSVVI